jgi:hypothetical protein
MDRHLEAHDSATFTDTAMVTIKINLWANGAHIVVEHERAALDARRQALEAQEGSDSAIFGRMLREEMHHSMLAIAATAFAFDAIYGEVIQLGAVPAGLVRRWDEARTSRCARIIQTLKLSFRLGPAQQRWTRDIRRVFDWRDDLVHPKSKFAAPREHPTGTRTGHENVEYAVDSASASVDLLLDVLEVILADGTSAKTPRVKEWARDDTLPANLRSYRATGMDP